MAKNLELISDYYKYEFYPRIFTSIGAVSVLLGATHFSVHSNTLVSFGFGIIGSCIANFINLKDDLSTIDEIQKYMMKL